MAAQNMASLKDVDIELTQVEVSCMLVMCQQLGIFQQEFMVYSIAVGPIIISLILTFCCLNYSIIH